MRLGVDRWMLRPRRLLVRGGRPGLWRSSARGNSVKEIGSHQNRARKEGIGRSQSRENQHPRATSIIRIKGSESDLPWETTISEGKFPDMAEAFENP